MSTNPKDAPDPVSTPGDQGYGRLFQPIRRILRDRRPTVVMLAIAFGLVIMAVMIWLALDYSYQQEFANCGWSGSRSDCESNVERVGVRQWVIAAAIGFVVVIAWGLTFWYLVQENRSQLRQDALIHELSTIDREATQDQGGPESDGVDLGLNALWSHNRGRLDLYHRLVTEYAKDARRLTIAVLGVGFAAVVLIGFIGIITSDTTGGAISASAITAAGAVLTGFIGRAVIVNSANSSKELAVFAAHPIEVERALNAERIIQNMPEDKRSAAQLLLVEYLTVGPRDKKEATE